MQLTQLEEMLELVNRLKDALGTNENGEALVEVARNAHRAEIELAVRLRKEQEDD